PEPAGRRRTDRERSVAGLETARWATADMAYRRSVLEAVGGFDPFFPRAYREDADLALRVRALGWRLVRGRREVVHPVRVAPWWESVRLQRGNRDDVRMWAIHGAGWRRRAGAPAGAFPTLAVATVAALGAAVSIAAGRRRAAPLLAASWLSI